MVTGDIEQGDPFSKSKQHGRTKNVKCLQLPLCQHYAGNTCNHASADDVQYACELAFISMSLLFNLSAALWRGAPISDQKKSLFGH